MRSQLVTGIDFCQPRLDHYAHTIIGHDVDYVDDAYALSEMYEDDKSEMLCRCYVEIPSQELSGRFLWGEKSAEKPLT